MSPAFNVRLERRVVKQVAALDEKIRRQVVARVNELAANPRPHDSKALKGPENTYRIDSGEYRIIYDIDYDARLITVWRIGHRRDVYRNL